MSLINLDAIVEWVIAEACHNRRRDPNKKGLLVFVKKIAENKVLSKLSVALGLDSFVKDPRHLHAVEEYMRNFHYNNLNSSLYDNNKVLGDLFETVVGALCLDLDYNLTEIGKILSPLFNPLIDLAFRDE